MNRRDALALLTSLPAVGTVARADVRPGSVVVFTCPGALSADTCARLMQQLRAVFPEPQRIVILSDGATLSVLDPRGPA